MLKPVQTDASVREGTVNEKQGVRVYAPRATIRDIAARAGVSVTTVSRVLNGRPDVSSATRNAVLRHVEESGYATNRGARGLVSGRSGLIGIVVPVVQAEYFSQIVEGAAEALYEHDARVILCPTRNEHDREVSLLRGLMHDTADGAILIHPSETNAELLRPRDEHFPFVVVDPPVPIDERIPVVAAENWSGARIATEHLLGLGHRRIAVISGPSRWNASRDRLAGYHSALLRAGLAPIPELECASDFTVEGGQGAAEALLALSQRPTAIFAFNDNMAVGALHAARECGLLVPEQLSVVGFDDVELAARAIPPLTTVRQPLQEIGRVAVSLLWRFLEGMQIEAAPILLSTRLVARKSTDAPHV